jgi:hypothetical protein
MIWPAVVVLVVVLAVGFAIHRRTSPSGEVDYQVLVGLHRARARLAAAVCKTEMRCDALRVRREMRWELERLERRGRH